jgi:hypothetical protein
MPMLGSIQMAVPCADAADAVDRLIALRLGMTRTTVRPHVRLS